MVDSIVSAGENPFESLAVALVSALNLLEDKRRLVELEVGVKLKGDRSTLQNLIADLTHGDRLGEDVTRVLLIADQFEEIYTLCTESEERKTFLDSLLQAVNNAPFLTLVLTLRADFLSLARVSSLQVCHLPLHPYTQKPYELWICRKYVCHSTLRCDRVL